jgi:hypothetical protein
MNETTRLETPPEVVEFLDRVRARLADLSEEERDDLLGGLEADLTELVTDGGSVAELGDPRGYADELRAAAGLEHSTRRRPRVGRPRRPPRETVTTWLDEPRDRWAELTASQPWSAQSWSVVKTLRPVWWVLRAWVAVQLLDLAAGPWEYATLVPRFGDDLLSLLVLGGAVAGSVLLGLRRFWPASHAPASAFARVLLLGLNVLALLMAVPVVDHFPSSSYLHDVAHPRASGMFAPYTQPGLTNDGHTVRNVFAFDAQGQPLEGIQLFDQAGRPLAVDPHYVTRMRYAGRMAKVYSWKNGEQKVWNVYPLPLRLDHRWGRTDRAWTSANPPSLPMPPLAAVPPVTLPSTGTGAAGDSARNR